MTREEILEYVKNKYGTNPEYLWLKHPGFAVLRNMNGKWYGIIMNVPADKLGLSGTDDIDIINVKCDPVMVSSLRLRDGYLPAYHMNKENWISIIINNQISADEIKNLVDMSYELITVK